MVYLRTINYALEPAKMKYHVAIDGRGQSVTNALSCGPGCTPHTFELTNAGRGGRYVQRIGAQWMLQEPGQTPRNVKVIWSAHRDPA